MPHVFDHTPTAQEVFDQACAYFATTEGPSVVDRSYGTNCLYRAPTGRECVAGHFIPNDCYDPAMDEMSLLPDYKGGGSGIGNVYTHLSRKLPSWFGEQLPLLSSLQKVHDECRNRTEDHRWIHSGVATMLSHLAITFNLNPSAIDQVRAKCVPAGWQSVEA